MHSQVKLILLLFISLVTTLGFLFLFNQVNPDKTFSRISILEDQHGTLQISDVLTSEYASRFRPSESQVLNFGISESSYWLRFQTHEKYQKQEHLLMIAGTPIIEHMTLYAPDAHGQYSRQNSGFAVPINLREIPFQNFVFPLPPPSDQPYFIRLNSRYSIQFISIILTYAEFHKYALKNNLIMGAMFGIIITVLIYNLLVYIFIRDTNYLYFALFLSSILLLILSLSGSAMFIFPSGFGKWCMNHLHLWTGIGTLSWILFVCRTLDIKYQTPTWYSLHQLVMVLSVVTIILSLTNRQIWIIYFVLFVAALTTFLTTISLLLGILRHTRIAVFILLAFLPSTVGAYYNILVYMGVSGSVFMAIETLSMGLALSSIFFSLGLADQIYVVKLEKEQYADELEKKNEELLSIQNELFNLVDNRTSDLRYANIELSKKNEELELARNNADLANHMKSEFLANISHELRTPMHHILSYSRIGLKRISNNMERAVECFRNITSAGERMMSLLNDLLDLSKLESDNSSFEMWDTDLMTIINQTIRDVDIEIREKKVQVEIVPPDAPTNLLCDPVQIGHLVQNLLMNAVRYTHAESKIEIEFKQSDSPNDTVKQQPGLTVCFRDEGIGIPEEELELIFDKFTQSSRTKTGAGGTGLGLAISKEIVLAHNGFIWAENNTRGGATISFFLPYQQESTAS